MNTYMINLQSKNLVIAIYDHIKATNLMLFPIFVLVRGDKGYKTCKRLNQGIFARTQSTNMNIDPVRDTEMKCFYVLARAIWCTQIMTLTEIEYVLRSYIDSSSPFHVCCKISVLLSCHSNGTVSNITA